MSESQNRAMSHQIIRVPIGIARWHAVVVHRADGHQLRQFRRAAEIPIYRIEKSPRPSRRQGPYSVISATGLILKRGDELERVLRVLDPSLRLVAG